MLCLETFASCFTLQESEIHQRYLQAKKSSLVIYNSEKVYKNATVEPDPKFWMPCNPQIVKFACLLWHITNIKQYIYLKFHFIKMLLTLNLIPFSWLVSSKAAYSIRFNVFLLCCCDNECMRSPPIPTFQFLPVVKLEVLSVDVLTYRK